jgi:protein SCO1/2
VTAFTLPPGTRDTRPDVGHVVRWTLRRLGTRRRAVGVVLLAAGVLAGCASPSSSGYATINSVASDGAASPYLGTPIDEPYTLPKATWTDTSGATVQWPKAGLPDPVTVVFFGYTNCPDVCPTQMADITQAIRASDPAVQARTGVVFVTVDPQRDDAATLRAYLDRFDATLGRPYVGLRNDDTDVVARAATAMGIALTGTSTTTHGYEVGHGAQLIGFGPDGTAPVIWTPGTPVGDIKADLATLSQLGGGESSS